MAREGGFQELLSHFLLILTEEFLEGRAAARLY
jgi:hypothetical protein